MSHPLLLACLCTPAILLAGCGAAPEGCIRHGETATVTRVTSQDVRGGTEWYVAFRDASGHTRVCSANEKVQALQPGDKIDAETLGY